MFVSYEVKKCHFMLVFPELPALPGRRCVTMPYLRIGTQVALAWGWKFRQVHQLRPPLLPQTHFQNYPHHPGSYHHHRHHHLQLRSHFCLKQLPKSSSFLTTALFPNFLILILPFNLNGSVLQLNLKILEKYRKRFSTPELRGLQLAEVCHLHESSLQPESREIAINPVFVKVNL